VVGAGEAVHERSPHNGVVVDDRNPDQVEVPLGCSPRPIVVREANPDRRLFDTPSPWQGTARNRVGRSVSGKRVAGHRLAGGGSTGSTEVDLSIPSPPSASTHPSSRPPQPDGCG
jgi:hypothetical protein